MPDHSLPLITEVNDLCGKYAMVRSSLNVPIQDGKVANTFRLAQSIPTIEFLREKGARIILVSHIGRNEDETLVPVYEELQKFFPLSFCPEVTGATALSMRNALEDGEVLLLENVRQDARETKNDMSLAEDLASLADIFVNDDFAASHRAHASLHAICSLLPSYAGIGLGREYTELSKVMHPEQPALFVLGGAKFETKMPLVEKYLDIYDTIFIGGALANDLFKAKGYEIGTSLVSDVSTDLSKLLSHPKVLMPVDVVVEKDGVRRIARPDEIAKDEAILDVGPESIELLLPYIAQAKIILWNGPMGNYERGYQEQTLSCAQAIAQSAAYSVVGGGDTVAAIEKLDLQEQFGFLSTAGGAMLTFLELGSLPALDALQDSRR